MSPRLFRNSLDADEFAVVFKSCISICVGVNDTVLLIVIVIVVVVVVDALDVTE
jgi:hypothetical protein